MKRTLLTLLATVAVSVDDDVLRIGPVFVADSKRMAKIFKKSLKITI